MTSRRHVPNAHLLPNRHTANNEVWLLKVLSWIVYSNFDNTLKHQSGRTEEGLSMWKGSKVSWCGGREFRGWLNLPSSWKKLKCWEAEWDSAAPRLGYWLADQVSWICSLTTWSLNTLVWIGPLPLDNRVRLRTVNSTAAEKSHRVCLHVLARETVQ